MRRRNPNVLGWTFIGPAFLHLLAFALIPMGYALYVSLRKMDLFHGTSHSVGTHNYSVALQEESFWNAMWNSFRFAFMSVPVGMAVALGVAILVNQKLRGMTIFRTVFYIPAVVSGIATAMLWIYIFLPETGLINTTLGFFHMKSIDFLNKPEWAMPALAFMSIWTGLGPRMVLFIAGLLGIPEPLYEAAAIDGASPGRQFWSITLPMLVPTTLFVLVTSTIGAMQVFTPIYMMTKGGPEESTDVIGYHIYTEAWVNFNTGLAAAKSFILLAVIAVISVIQMRMIKPNLD
jgi:multiple sugar transport system permease protein